MKISAPFLVLLSVALFEGANAAGNEEKIIIRTQSQISQFIQNRTSYKCTFRNLWTKERQPKNFPQELGRWDGPIMWTHTLQFEPWRAGDAVTRGVEKLAEDGFTDVLIQEMEQQGEQVKDWSEYEEGGFFVRERDWVHLPPLETDIVFPYMSVMAGMSPSPDWYTGWYSFWLIDEVAEVYYDHIKIQTYPWDAGTDGGATYDSLISDLDPPLPIERFRPNNAPEGGELMNEARDDVPVVAEWECFLVVGDVDMELPDCDWFANPCCNETDKENCGATLPNGAMPSMTPELLQVRENSPSGSHAISYLMSFAGLAVMQWILA